jgi:hypothetical protein
MLHLQKVVGGALNVLADLMTMSRSIEKRPQDEHVKRSLEEPDPLLYLFRHGRHSTFNLETMVGIRLSIVNGLANCGFSNDDFRPKRVSSPKRLELILGDLA